MVEDVADALGVVDVDAAATAGVDPEKLGAEDFQKIIRTIIQQHLQAYSQQVQESVLNPLSDLQYYLASPLKLIQKRNDKLLDCDRLRHKINNTEASTTVDFFKIKGFQKELEEVRRRVLVSSCKKPSEYNGN